MYIEKRIVSLINVEYIGWLYIEERNLIFLFFIGIRFNFEWIKNFK